MCLGIHGKKDRTAKTAAREFQFSSHPLVEIIFLKTCLSLGCQNCQSPQTSDLFTRRRGKKKELKNGFAPGGDDFRICCVLSPHYFLPCSNLVPSDRCKKPYFLRFSSLTPSCLIIVFLAVFFLRSRKLISIYIFFQ